MYIPISLLRRYVYESNLIEGVRAAPHMPLFTSHLKAAVTVVRLSRQGQLIHPLEIHEMVCRDTYMESFGGKMRTCGVRVGRRTCPKWENVPGLMDEWWSLVKESYETGAALRQPKNVRAAIAQVLHNELLCIHPFEDVNGRTSRLSLNNIRLCYGLPWLIIEASKKGAYYAHIQHTEKRFKSRHRDAYPKHHRTARKQ